MYCLVYEYVYRYGDKQKKKSARTKKFVYEKSNERQKSKLHHKIFKRITIKSYTVWNSPINHNDP